MALVRGGIVRAHVQAFADAVADATGAESFGTYAGHDPSLDLATDIFVPVASDVLGNAICEFLRTNWERFGVDYWIYRQGIWNPPDRLYRRQMEDRGGVTQNHYDHVHVSFEPTAPGPFGPDPTPQPTPVPVPKEPEVAKVVYPVSIGSGESRRVPVPAIGGGFGWSKAAVTYSSTGVEVRKATVGPNVRNIPRLAPSGPSTGQTFGGRDYIDLAAGDEWLDIELAASPDGTLELMVEASDG